jgi:hypothetical protein
VGDKNYHGNEHLPHKHSKSQTTADYQLTKVKLHLLKKTTAMNIKFRIGKRERESNGRNERENYSRENLQLSHLYTENIIKTFYIKYYRRNVWVNKN